MLYTAIIVGICLIFLAVVTLVAGSAYLDARWREARASATKRDLIAAGRALDRFCTAVFWVGVMLVIVSAYFLVSVSLL